MKKLSISLDDDLYEFVESISPHNKSALVTKALRFWQKKTLEEAILSGMSLIDQDAALQEEAVIWEQAVSDCLRGTEDA